MKDQPIHKAVLFILLTFVAATAGSQSVVGTMDGSGTPGIGLRKNGRNAVRTVKPAATPNPLAIRGVCNVIQSSAMMLPGPCVNIMLVLNDDQGKEVERTRTNAQGVFEFSVDNNKPYRLVSGSRLYEIVTPQGDVHAGSSIALKIREK